MLVGSRVQKLADSAIQPENEKGLVQESDHIFDWQAMKLCGFFSLPLVFH